MWRQTLGSEHKHFAVKFLGWTRFIYSHWVNSGIVKSTGWIFINTVLVAGGETCRGILIYKVTTHRVICMSLFRRGGATCNVS